jgi:hypothetical protein
MIFEKLTDFFTSKEEKEAERHQENIRKYLDMEEEMDNNPDQLPLAELKKMRHLDPDTVPDSPWPIGKWMSKDEFGKIWGVPLGEEPEDLPEVPRKPEEKPVVFGSEPMKINLSVNKDETGAISKETLNVMSEKWRQYLSLPFKREKGLKFLEIEKEKEVIKKVFGAKEVILDLNGDISIVHSDGRQEKIFVNPGAPVKSPTQELPSEEVLAILEDELKK